MRKYIEIKIEGTFVNRVVRWTEQGFEHEAGMRHVDTMVAELGLQGAKGVKTPGEMNETWEVTETLNNVDSKKLGFRAPVSKRQFLGVRSHEHPIHCASLMQRHVRRKLTPLTRYLMYAPGVVWIF